MTDVELAALTTLVSAETADINASVAKYGEAQWDPNTAARQVLERARP